MKNITAFLVASIVFPITLAFAQAQAQAPTAAGPTAEAPRQTTESELKATIEKLQPDSVVLEIDGQTATWRDLFPHIQNAVKELNNGRRANRTSPREAIRSMMQKLAARRMFALEAKRLDLIPDDEARKKIESKIEENLLTDKRNRFKTLAQYAASLELMGHNLLNASLDDIINIMYLNGKLFDDIQITEHELDLYIRYKKAVNKGIDTLNVQKRNAMNKLAQDPSLQTDEGFKKLAREYSEGVEAAWGGELRYDFTRKELAEVNEIKEFNWKAGEVTPVLETGSAMRIMRVLRNLPKETPQSPEKLRVAQILVGKLGDSENLNDKEGIKTRLIPQKQKALIEEYIYQMSQRYKVKTLLFPEGLWSAPGKSLFTTPAIQTEATDSNASQAQEKQQPVPGTEEKTEK